MRTRISRTALKCLEILQTIAGCICLCRVYCWFSPVACTLQGESYMSVLWNSLLSSPLILLMGSWKVCYMYITLPWLYVLRHWLLGILYYVVLTCPQLFASWGPLWTLPCPWCTCDALWWPPCASSPTWQQWPSTDNPVPHHGGFLHPLKNILEGKPKSRKVMAFFF